MPSNAGRSVSIFQTSPLLPRPNVGGSATTPRYFTPRRISLRVNSTSSIHRIGGPSNSVMVEKPAPRTHPARGVHVGHLTRLRTTQRAPHPCKQIDSRPALPPHPNAATSLAQPCPILRLLRNNPKMPKPGRLDPPIQPSIRHRPALRQPIQMVPVPTTSAAANVPRLRSRPFPMIQTDSKRPWN